jgi:hypothetical protein
MKIYGLWKIMGYGNLLAMEIYGEPEVTKRAVSLN